MKYTPRFKSGKQIMQASLMTVLLLAGFPDAHASRDGKLYPGSFCKAADIDSPDVEFGLNTGSITNISTTNRLLVYCPIIKDIIQSPSWEKVVVTYSNPNPSTRIRCSVTVRNEYGDFISTRNSYSALETTFGLMRLYGTEIKTSGATYTMNCELPPTPANGIALSAIHFFQVIEKD